MALQSQMARSNARTPNVSFGKSNGQKKILAAAALVLAAGAGFWYLLRDKGSQAAMADNTVTIPQASNAPQPGATPPAPVSTPPSSDTRPPLPQVTSKPAPDVLEMASARPNAAPAPAETPKPSLAVQQPGTTPTNTPAPKTDTPAPSTSPTALMPASAAPGTPTGTPGNGPSTSPLPTTVGGLPADLASLKQQAEQAINSKKLVEARSQLNKVLVDPRLSDAERGSLRKQLSDLNKDLVFSPQVFAGDTMSETYNVQKGDNLIRISRKLNTVTEAHFINRVNNLPDANTLRVGQALKIVRGPFHAVVSKSAYRMDVYAGPAVSPGSIGQNSLGGGAEPGWTYICSFPVGLGEKGVTPLGAFTVKDSSKLINPPWVNPRTGEKFDKDDPKNPIGERWIGLVGLDDKTRNYTGYGIHGTIDPGSIGQDLSMGCVRMQSADVEIVYEMLMPRISVVKIVP